MKSKSSHTTEKHKDHRQRANATSRSIFRDIPFSTKLTPSDQQHPPTHSTAHPRTYASEKYTYIQTHTRTHIYIHTHTHTHIYIYIHTHTHIKRNATTIPNPPSQTHDQKHTPAYEKWTQRPLRRTSTYIYCTNLISLQRTKGRRRQYADTVMARGQKGPCTHASARPACSEKKVARTAEDREGEGV